ncbi:hypothetical protein A2960_00235 [Candidatus Gottesmanbacteria bacterium RIFCSPLOWO2_01_FULL_39_12b]|uniref:DUF11 domain-containing protein n=1 Tax=Candidatus Gottesmanbacteria bacterium RIFCSPLOWO2_01_FULL_39_12b TaxID=1798388 RepID=A0A1F6ARB7_9BACT|nr:MAG: hypothetical protein A2960_00235 [Candidatus Gottesmanbacteria bacterium RIFCSPLOWO2_01_FULL_39_12b]
MKIISGAVFFLTAVVLTLVTNISYVSASGGCVPVYGGGVQCPRPGQVLIDKTVRNPSTGVYVDNLGPNDPRYRPEWIITFNIVVKNPGDETLDTVTVADTLPQYMDYMSLTGATGNYNSTTRTLTWTVSNLTGGSSQLFQLRGRIVHPSLLPADRNVICPIAGNPQPVNIVDSRASNGQTDHDESQFCIEKELVVPQVPKAGPEHWILSLVGIGTALTIGLYLRKKATASLKIGN